jgi:hypothetical protein
LSGLSTDLCSTPVFTANNFNVTALGSTVNIHVDQVQTTLTSRDNNSKIKIKSEAPGFHFFLKELPGDISLDSLDMSRFFDFDVCLGGNFCELHRRETLYINEIASLLRI